MKHNLKVFNENKDRPRLHFCFSVNNKIGAKNDDPFSAVKFSAVNQNKSKRKFSAKNEPRCGHQMGLRIYDLHHVDTALHSTNDCVQLQMQSITRS